jgi:CrcB protein
MPFHASPAHRWVLLVVALGGMAGSSARYLLEETWPAAGGTLPVSTLAVNVSGCLLIGVLMVHVAEVGGAHPLLRPFLGVGVLGGYTTFSTYAVEVRSLLDDGRTGLAVAYFLGTAVSALLAVGVGVYAARAAARARRWLGEAAARRQEAR